MPSERIQRQIDRLLDEAERTFGARDWLRLKAHALDVLKLDADNGDAQMSLAAAEQGLAEGPILPASFPRGEGGDGGSEREHLPMFRPPGRASRPRLRARQ